MWGTNPFNFGDRVAVGVRDLLAIAWYQGKLGLQLRSQETRGFRH